VCERERVRESESESESERRTLSRTVRTPPAWNQESRVQVQTYKVQGSGSDCSSPGFKYRREEFRVEEQKKALDGASLRGVEAFRARLARLL